MFQVEHGQQVAKHRPISRDFYPGDGGVLPPEGNLFVLGAFPLKLWGIL